MDRFDGAREKGKRDREGRDLLEKIEKAGVYEVPIRTLILEKDGIGIDDRSVDRLVESASRRGGWIHYPVVQKATNKVIVGKRRILADKKAGKAKVFVRIVDLTDQEASLWRLEENAVRFNPDKKELYVTFKALRDSFGMKQTEMAVASGFSEGRISQILKWGDAGFVGSAGRPPPESLTVKESESNESGKGGYDNAAEKSAGAGLGEARIKQTGNVAEDAAETHQQVPESDPGNPPAPDSLKPDLLDDEHAHRALDRILSQEPPEKMEKTAGASGEILPASPPATPEPADPFEGIIGLVKDGPPTDAAEPEFVTADRIPLAQDTPPTLGAASTPAPSFSVPVSPSDLGPYRGFVNAYVQTAIKAAKKGDADARTHLHALYAAISEALN